MTSECNRIKKCLKNYFECSQWTTKISLFLFKSGKWQQLIDGCFIKGFADLPYEMSYAIRMSLRETSFCLRRLKKQRDDSEPGTVECVE